MSTPDRAAAWQTAAALILHQHRADGGAYRTLLHDYAVGDPQVLDCLVHLARYGLDGDTSPEPLLRNIINNAALGSAP